MRRALENSPAPKPSPAERLAARASAVVAPIYAGDDGLATVVLTRRSWALRSHTGEVSFPGGAHDPDDPDLWATACREAHEEIGLDPATIRPIGELHHLATVTSRSFIVPYVGLLDDPPVLDANPHEVDAILHVSLAELLHDDVYRQERWGIGGVARSIHFFELYGDTVWGATGAMLVDLLSRVTRTGEP